MKKITTFMGALCMGSLAYAGSHHMNLVLDKVAFQVSAKQWVSTDKALLRVAIYATLNNADLMKARADVLSHLNKITAGDWHITRFDRSQDSSGLEKLMVEAQNRVLQSNLTNVYQAAKDVSQPGATYKIMSIEFEPDLDDVQLAKNQLRAHLYELARDEIARLNKVYPDQHFSLNQLMFVDGSQPAQPQFARAQKMMNEMAMAPAAAPMSVSNELVMSAVVQAASDRPKETKTLAPNP